MAYPEAPLTLLAFPVGDDGAQFEVSGGKTPGAYEINTGDGGRVPVTLDENGNGASDPYTYTMPGERTYTASITVPVTVPWADWTAVADGFATWPDVPDGVSTWGAFALTSETATAEVQVNVPSGTPWPEDELTLSVVVTDSDTGHNFATFTLEHAHATGITVPLDPGDGTTSVDMAIGADGTATGTKTYTHTGRHVYTATVTVPLTPRYATWADVPASVATWGAFVNDTRTWGYVYADSETASCQVEVFVGNGAIWATPVNATPPYAQIDMWSGKPDQIVSWSITRHCPDVPVLDDVVIQEGKAFSGALSLQDTEAPWGVPVTYSWTVVYADGTSETFTSEPIVLYGPAGFGGCWITDPASGSTMRITIQAWTEREREARQSILTVMNRPDPVVLSDVHTWASSEIVFITRSKGELQQARAILFGSRLILVRSWVGSSIETAYLAVGNVTEARLYEYDAAAWHRSITVAAQEVRPLPATAGDLQTSWLDLAEAFATWADVDAYFPTWTDVVQWNTDLMNITAAPYESGAGVPVTA